jgi:hypothetical protein
MTDFMRDHHPQQQGEVGNRQPHMIGDAIVEDVNALEWTQGRAEDLFVETVQLAFPGHHLFGHEQHIRMKGASG